jgi:purine nucleosidase
MAIRQTYYNQSVTTYLFRTYLEYITMKLLLDTDIGSDIDDAVCLAYLLAQPKCELLGITTVTGQAVERAELASVLVKVAGQDIPIYPGVEEPLLVSQRQPEAKQARALIRWPHRTDFPKGEAIEFLRRTIRAHPGEITLLTIGPLTNIALLFSVDPEIPRLLQELVLMCGIFTDTIPGAGPLEWNAMLDPHASAIVYRAPVPKLRSIGLDVTLKVTMPAAEVRQRFNHPRLTPVLDFAEVWFNQADKITFHDPLAATTIFNQEIVTFEPGRITIDLDKEPGRTLWRPGVVGSSQSVGLNVNAAKFFEEYFGVFKA